MVVHLRDIEECLVQKNREIIEHEGKFRPYELLMRAKQKIKEQLKNNLIIRKTV